MNSFTKKDTNKLKGIAILVIVCHHVFWNSFFVDGTTQIFIFPILTAFITRWGFCFNHVFAALTGFGMAFSLSNKQSSLKYILEREVQIIGLVIPVYIIASVSFILLDGFIRLYSQNHIPVSLSILLDMGGYSDIFRLVKFNPTWWYFGATHVITIAVCLIDWLSKKSYRFLQHVYLLAVVILSVLMFVRPILYGCMILSALVGACIYKYNVIEKIDSFVSTVNLRKYIKSIVIFVFSFALLLIWSIGVRYKDPHFISAIFLPLSCFLLVKEFLKIECSIFELIGKNSSYIFMIHTFIYSVFCFSSQWVYSFRYAFATYLSVIIFSVLIGCVIDKIEVATNYKYVLSIIRKGVQND